MDPTTEGSTKSSTWTLWTPQHQDQLKAQRESYGHHNIRIN